MRIGLLEVEIRDIEQDLIPYVRQLVLADVPIEGWIIDSDVHGLLDSSCDVVCLPTHNGEVVNPGMMTCGVGMVMDGERGPEMFLEPFPKGPCRFPYVLLITLQLVTLVHLSPYGCCCGCCCYYGCWC